MLGRDFVDDDEDPSEEGGRTDPGWGHGTHVAGLVALAAPGTRLMPLRVLDRRGRGNAWVLAEALAWVVDPDGNPATDDGAHLVNLSLGTTQPTKLLSTVVALASCEFDDDDDDYNDFGFDDDRARCGFGHGAAVLAAGVAALVMATPAPSPRPGTTGLRQWDAEDLLKRLEDRAAVVCGASQKQLDAVAAVTDGSPFDLACP